jgi:sugar lactone lactonase YvrE
LLEFGHGQISSGGLSNSIAVDRSERIYVPSTVEPTVKIFDNNGNLINSFRVPLAADGIAVSSKGQIFLAPVVARAESLIYTFSSDGKYLGSIGKRITRAHGELPREINRIKLAVDSKDNLFVIFQSWPLIRIYSPSGDLLAENFSK